MSDPTHRQEQNNNRWARPSDWDTYRTAIQDLYLGQNLSLKEVIVTMQRAHGFYATERMYKTRIKDWGFDKKIKHHEVVQLLRLRKEREAVGKATVFTIRGREVDWDRIDSYVKRKGLDVATLVEDPTHSPEVQRNGDISWRSPSPDPEPSFSDSLGPQRRGGPACL